MGVFGGEFDVIDFTTMIFFYKKQALTWGEL
jgi:hypothetical protein